MVILLCVSGEQGTCTSGWGQYKVYRNTFIEFYTILVSLLVLTFTQGLVCFSLSSSDDPSAAPGKRFGECFGLRSLVMWCFWRVLLVSNPNKNVFHSCEWLSSHCAVCMLHQVGFFFIKLILTASRIETYYMSTCLFPEYPFCDDNATFTDKCYNNSSPRTKNLGSSTQGICPSLLATFPLGRSNFALHI